MKRLLVCLLVLILPVAAWGASATFKISVGTVDAPRVFLHMSWWAVANWSKFATNPQVQGAHVSFSWAAIDSGGGTYDWSSVENAIAPWSAAGKTVALNFAGAYETLSQGGASNTALATPTYVLNQISQVDCTDVLAAGIPPSPVFWQSAYVSNWETFIQAAITRYQDDPRIAYLRFGIGVGGESYVMNAASSSQTCVDRWNAAGMSYTQWLAYSDTIIDFIGGLHPRKPIAVGLNDIHVWDTSGDLGYATAEAAEATKFGFFTGMAGFSGQHPDWNAIYLAQTPRTYLQTASPELIDTGLFPVYLPNANPLRIQAYELYPEEYDCALNNVGCGLTTQAAVSSALNALGIPQIAGITPNWVSSIEHGPSLSGVAAAVVDQSHATIGWSSDQSTDSRVNYGLTASYGSTALADSNPLTSAHSVALSGLTPGATYHFAAVSTNSAGQAATSPDQTITMPSNPGDVTAGVLPSYDDAYPNWKNAGLQSVGGIPNRTTVCATVSPRGGSLDDFSNIQNAINNCPAGEVVQLAAGAFKIFVADGTINIQSGITLRGASCPNSSSPYCQTSITVADGALAYTAGSGSFTGCGLDASHVVNCPNGGSGMIQMGSSSPWIGNAVAFAADAAQGQATIQVASMSGFSVGDIVYMDEDCACGWVADPMGSFTNYGQVWATSDWLSSSGSPATGRLVWPAANGSSGWDMGTTNPTTGGSEGCWFAINCGRATGEFHQIASIGAGPCPGANCTLTFDDPLTTAFRQTGGHNAKVYKDTGFYKNLGVENISLLRGPTGGIQSWFCAYCWIKNVEVSDWDGGAVSMMASFRMEMNGVLGQYCWWCTNNGGEYTFDLNHASTEILITNSISQFGGKAMTVRGAGAGSVVSYNYFDKTMYVEAIPDTWIEMSANASHYVGPHHVLFEGNQAVNLDADNTHGSTQYITYFRNWSMGVRSQFTDPATNTVVNDATNIPGGNGPRRAAGPMTYNYWFSFVGNVLGTSGVTTAANGWFYSTTCGWCQDSIFMLGWNTGNGGADPYLDGVKGAYLFRHGNYDYVNNAVLWDSGTTNHNLPSSFYLASAPSFFSAGASCAYPWPWVTPTGSTQLGKNSCNGSGLPAKARYDAGTPFVQP